MRFAAIVLRTPSYFSWNLPGCTYRNGTREIFDGLGHKIACELLPGHYCRLRKQSSL
jgi:hypothetical protein